jgi:hypothetical protein
MNKLSAYVRKAAAVEALRRARATMDNYSSVPEPRAFWLDECLSTEARCMCRDMAASALLDGFTAKEVTAAEHTLEHPHG